MTPRCLVVCRASDPALPASTLIRQRERGLVGIMLSNSKRKLDNLRPNLASIPTMMTSPKTMKISSGQVV